jgi:hypothetical protein
VNLADVMTSQVDACTPKASFNEIAVKMKDLDVGGSSQFVKMKSY